MGTPRRVQALPLLLLLVSAAACGGVRTVEKSTSPPLPATTVEVEKNMVSFELDTIGSDRRTFNEDVLPVNAGEQVLVTINHAHVADGAFPGSSFR